MIFSLPIKFDRTGEASNLGMKAEYALRTATLANRLPFEPKQQKCWKRMPRADSSNAIRC